MQVAVFLSSKTEKAKYIALWRLNEFMFNKVMLCWQLNFKTYKDFSKMH